MKKNKRFFFGSNRIIRWSPKTLNFVWKSTTNCFFTAFLFQLLIRDGNKIFFINGKFLYEDTKFIPTVSLHPLENEDQLKLRTRETYFSISLAQGWGFLRETEWPSVWRLCYANWNSSARIEALSIFTSMTV